MRKYLITACHLRLLFSYGLLFAQGMLFFHYLLPDYKCDWPLIKSKINPENSEICDISKFAYFGKNVQNRRKMLS